MKRIFTLLLAASALTAAVSCQKEISAPETEAPVYETMTITASTAAETKTSLGENGYSSFWSAGDQISVFDSNKGANNRCFTIVEENVEFPAKTATFSYTGEFVMPQNEQPNPTVVALYPYQENAYCDFFYYDHADITGINLPEEQTAVANGFDSDATFALALGTMATKENLAFNNLYSLLKFTVSTPNVKKVTVTIEGEDAFIAGEAKIDLTINLANVQEGKPAFESPVLTASGSKTVTLTCEEGFATDATYYIAVAPVTYTSLAVALDEVEVKKSTTAKTLEANTVYGLGELTTPIPMAKINVLAKDVNWQNVNMVIDSKSVPMVETTIGNHTYFVAEVEANKTYDFAFNSGGTTNSHWIIERNDVSVDGDKYYRLSPKGAIEIDPNDESTFGYAIYVFDQKSKNMAPNLYVWNDNNAFSETYSGWNYNWSGTAFSKDCYYKPADNNGWRHYYYIDIPTDLYNGTFSFIVNKKGQTADIVIGTTTAKTDDIEISRVSSDLYVGYWYDNADSNGFWTTDPMSTPITNFE